MLLIFITIAYFPVLLLFPTCMFSKCFQIIHRSNYRFFSFCFFFFLVACLFWQRIYARLILNEWYTRRFYCDGFVRWWFCLVLLQTLLLLLLLVVLLLFIYKRQWYIAIISITDCIEYRDDSFRFFFGVVEFRDSLKNMCFFSSFQI